MEFQRPQKFSALLNRGMILFFSSKIELIKKLKAYGLELIATSRLLKSFILSISNA